MMAAFASGKPVIVTFETANGTVVEAEAIMSEISYSTDPVFSDGYFKPQKTVIDLSFKVIGDITTFFNTDYAAKVKKEREQDQWVCDYCKHVNPDEARYCGHKDVDRLRGCGANKPWRLL